MDGPDKAAGSRSLGGIGVWRRLRRMRTRERLFGAAVFWVVCTAALAAINASVVHCFRGGGPPFQLSDDDLATIVQVVSAVVIAIFVFAAGTAFVVAQVVPPARGTRAVELLRSEYVELTIAPALALTPLSCLVLPLPGTWATSLGTAVLAGSTLYLIAATACLLRILKVATTPRAYRKYLRYRFLGAIDDICAERVRPADGGADAARGALRGGELPPSGGGGVQDLYRMIRALRGWTRTAAVTGDSRELHVSLAAMLELVEEYASRVPVPQRRGVPINYIENATDRHVNSLDAEGSAVAAGVPAEYELARWADWVPRPLAQPTPRSKDDNEERSPTEVFPRVWVANEIGRLLVRAAELGSTSPALLERDRGRLSNSFAKVAHRFAERKDPGSVGVMVGYLVELGLGARRCPTDQVLWHFEPLVALVDLHLHFRGLHEKRGQIPQLELKCIEIGIAAGVLKVAEAITAARIRAFHEQNGALDWSGAFAPSDLEAANRTLHDLRQVVSPHDASWKLRLDVLTAQQLEGLTASEGRLGAEPDGAARALAKSACLEPRDQPRLRPPDPALVNRLADNLLGRL